MTQAILNQILNQLEELKPEELQQLNQAIQNHLAAKETVQKTTLHQTLLASGLVKQPKAIPQRRETQRQLIKVQGSPVSETIIEERR